MLSKKPAPFPVPGSSTSQRKKLQLTNPSASNAQNNQPPSQDAIEPKIAQSQMSQASQKTLARRISFIKKATEDEGESERPSDPYLTKGSFLKEAEKEPEDILESVPEWATKKSMRDADMKRPGDPGYNPSTLYIPPYELRKMTPAMRQYWSFKSKNFDKVILFKMGRFYEMFYEDAVLGQQLLDLKMMGGKMHVGFPEKSLDKNGSKLASSGYKCVIVEQIEPNKQPPEKARKNLPPEGEKISKREVAQVLTPGTHHDMFHDSFNPKYLWVFQTLDRPESYVLIVVEATTYQVRMIFMEEDKNLQFFKTAFFQLRPDEVVARPGFIDPVVFKMFQTAFFQPHLTPLSDSRGKVFWSSLKLEEKLGEIKIVNPDLEESLQAILAIEKSQRCFRENLNALLEYYKEIHLFERFALIGKAELIIPEEFKGTSMYLDSQAMVHLDLFEDDCGDKENKEEGSLFSFIDHAGTPAGRRLLKRWLCHPLLDPDVIVERQNAVEDLERCSPLRNTFLKTVQGLCDLDRLVQRLFTYGVKYNPGIVYFEDISEARLRELRTFFQELRVAIAAVENLAREPNFSSARLRFLLTPLRKGGGFPNAYPVITEFEKQIIWEDNTPTPIVGLDKEYDELRDEIYVHREKLNGVLEEIKEQLQCETITFVHTKARYEIEVPEYVLKVRGKPRNFDLSSKRQGHSRFTTPKTRELVDLIENIEDKMKDTLAMFVKFIFKSFLDYRAIWQETIEVVTEIDALSALSVASHLQNFPMCRPKVQGPCDKPFITGKGLRHPLLALVNPDFQENNLNLGGDTPFMFLTGPNMGGKSTMLRQIATLAVLAQIGCFVPGERFELSVVDRIFTRLGASDKLMADKSTFFIEMEETVNILNEGTKHSLAIIDELGRGTSTFDGVAICHGVIDEIINRIQCRVVFATHYHMLIETCQMMKQVKFYYMDMVFEPSKDRMLFLHILKEGALRESHGINAGKIAGLDQYTIQRAYQKSIEFDYSLKFGNMAKIENGFNLAMNWIVANDQFADINHEQL